MQVKAGNPNTPLTFRCWQFLDSSVFKITSSAKPPLNGFESSKNSARSRAAPGDTDLIAQAFAPNVLLPSGDISVLSRLSPSITMTTAATNPLASPPRVPANPLGDAVSSSPFGREALRGPRDSP